MGPKIISIEGNIGAGKTTLFNKLEDANTDPSILFVSEPVNQWLSFRNPSSNETILSAYYKEQEKYAFPFQTMALMTRLSQLNRIIDSNPDVKLIITERSLQSDYEVFAQMLYKAQKMNTILYSIYQQIYKDFAKLPLNGVFFVNTDSLTCFERCGIRNRDGERVSLQYLRTCETQHYDWLNTLDIPILQIPSGFELQQQFAMYGFMQKVMIANSRADISVNQ